MRLLALARFAGHDFLITCKSLLPVVFQQLVGIKLQKRNYKCALPTALPPLSGLISIQCSMVFTAMPAVMRCDSHPSNQTDVK